jgi:hypothetical protein
MEADREAGASGLGRAAARDGAEGRRWPVALLLLAFVGGCTPLGLIRGDYWTGTSTGGIDACPPYEFQLVLDGDIVSGSATSEFPWGTVLWEVRGQLGAGRHVTLETRTDDPRVSASSQTWTGTYNPVLWEITQSPVPGCAQPRTARLQRR